MSNTKLTQLILLRNHSQADNYYYSKSLNDFMENARSTQVINFHYILNLNQEAEQLRRTYPINEIVNKITSLVHYYKFHNDIPRCFLPKIAEIMSNYHDKRRQVEYVKIKRMIDYQNKIHPDQPQKKIVGDISDLSITQRSGKKYSNILNNITETSNTIDKIKTKLNSIKLNVEDLQLMQSNREQEQLDSFLKHISKRKQKQSQVPNSLILKFPIGLSSRTIKQVLSRKMITQQQTQTTSINTAKTSKQLSQYYQPPHIQSSLKTNPKQLPTQKGFNHFGSFTQRVVKENPLSKLLSPLKIQLVNVNSPSNKCKTTVSISKQFKITDSLKLSSILHQHTKSDLKFFRKI
ncbi:unnamed protein product (macronuclear) [Paramecium tetraurelia]|uniref:Uncharacterized protein n=1 Tax=Paramecium tetraurelia TaxID=5888 RepID=A0EEI6_PARTE|nr:uncharacterized protein GSPATT00026049001 [Paramecium tetraurelia]CAK93716.1 unnamed protein product [Paramecium tetraurelia]|eukprot:XP_001461100.1 hypothetical protein (macronuclear) [Paramecium tetraurelia strain d4-2]